MPVPVIAPVTRASIVSTQLPSTRREAFATSSNSTAPKQGAFGVPPPATASVIPKASVGDLLPGDEEPRPQLSWDRRIGRWRDGSVYLVAPLVALIDVEITDAMTTLAEVQREIEDLLNTQLPEENAVLYIEDDGPHKKRQRLRVALSSRNSSIRAIWTGWQATQLCSGKAKATWVRTTDTTSSAHVAQLESTWNSKAAIDAMQLSLPARWFFTRTAWPDGNSASIPVSAHWHQFARIFGEVRKVEVVWESPGSATVQLIAQFLQPQSAKTAYELLAGRCLVNPLAKRKLDAAPVVIKVGLFQELKTEVLNRRSAADSSFDNLGTQDKATSKRKRSPVVDRSSDPLEKAVAAIMARPYTPLVAEGPPEPLYEITRLRPTTFKEASTRLRLSQARPQASLGRENWCDLTVQTDAVSRHHADFFVVAEERASSSSLEAAKLYIRDRSTNGTVLNERDLATGILHEVNDGDQITFRNREDPAGLKPKQPIFIVKRYETVAAANEAARAELEAACSTSSRVKTEVSTEPQVLPSTSRLPMTPYPKAQPSFSDFPSTSSRLPRTPVPLAQAHAFPRIPPFVPLVPQNPSTPLPLLDTKKSTGNFVPDCPDTSLSDPFDAWDSITSKRLRS